MMEYIPHIYFTILYDDYEAASVGLDADTALYKAHSAKVSQPRAAVWILLVLAVAAATTTIAARARIEQRISKRTEIRASCPKSVRNIIQGAKFHCRNRWLEIEAPLRYIVHAVLQRILQKYPK
jgi:hypothetical protein